MQNFETKGYGRCHKARPRSFFSKERQSWRWPFNFSVTAVNSRHREGTTANISVGPDVGRANLIAIGDTETFKTLSSSDLAGFRRLGQTFSCLDWAMTLANFWITKIQSN